jgi:hypothetical protein
LFFVVWSYHGPQKANHADWQAVAQQRDSEHRPMFPNASEIVATVLGVGKAIRQVDRTAFKSRSTD